MSSALVLRQLLEFNIFYLMTLVGFTAYLHALCPSLHMTYDDDSIWDVLLGTLMHILIYMMSENGYMVTVLFMLCGGVTFYRYTSYLPPIIPVDVKKELEKRQCSIKAFR
ncbi:hypothetical protein ACH5RR_009549 [Cinchona calisaya]|uniref:Uncharacterized protein n=1 Tax=Cinchona calisaya TaxID=153742 RepID=A0ABD3AH96_9GENT